MEGLKELESAILSFMSANGRPASISRKTTTGIGGFILALTAVGPKIPLAGKHLRDLSAKQRILFNSREYGGQPGDEFIGHWVEPGVYFLFSQRTVKIAHGTKIRPPSHPYKIIRHLCHERPDTVVPYEKLTMVVPRFVRDMERGMKYMRVDENLKFENAFKPRPEEGVWIKTEPVNVLLSILDHQDVHLHREENFIVIYTRWFGAYFEGE